MNTTSSKKNSSGAARNGRKEQKGQFHSDNVSVPKFIMVDEAKGHGKHIAGTYFEMALHNFMRVADYIFTRSNVKTIVGGLQDNHSMCESIARLKEAELSASQKSTLSRLVFRQMPFFGPLMADVVDISLYPFRKAIKELESDKKNNGKELEAARNALKRQIVGNSALQQIDYLETIAGELVSLRNEFSHKNHYNNQDDIHAQKIREAKLALWLEIIFKGERGILLERKTHSQKDTEFLTQDGKQNYNVNKNKKSTRNKDFYFGPGRKTDKEWELTDFGRFFFCQLFLKRSDAVRFAEEVGLFATSPFKLSESDRVKLQSVENQRAAKEQELAKSKGCDHVVKPRDIGPTESVQNNIIREMMDMHRIHIPREKRIDADQSSGILVMDILNELRKCPDDLYMTFSPDDKASFVRQGKSPAGDIVESKLVRYQDRFAELALRSIDLMGAFTDIRFHLRLGRFRYRFYDKTAIDGSSVKPVRTVQKDINGFGRWQDVEVRRTEKYGPMFQSRVINEDGLEQPEPDTCDTKPYITDWRTTYNIHAERVGLAWGLSQMKDGMYLPDLVTDNGDNHKRKAMLDMPAPMCYLSTYDLPALLFYIHIYKSYHGSKYQKEGVLNAEDIIKSKYNALVQYFKYAATEPNGDDLLAKQKELKLADDEIPSRLHDFHRLDFAAERRNHAIATLQAVVDEATDRLVGFEKKHDRITTGGRDNRYGRKGFADMRYGSIARYLAKSMIRWQPALSQQGGGKLTSPNFRVLADVLAEYGVGSQTEKPVDALKELRTVLKNAHLLDGGQPHPFLADAVLNKNPENIEQFYKLYLDAEKKYAQELIDKLKHQEKVALPTFARPDGLRWKTGFRGTATRYLEIPAAPFDLSTPSTHKPPILLPDGLFTQPILDLLRLVLNDKTNPESAKLEPLRTLLGKNDGHPGAAYIIHYWFDQVEKDSPQAFFGSADSKRYRRFYKPVSMLAPNRKSNRQLIPDYFSEHQIAEKLKYTQKKNREELKKAVVSAYNLKKNGGPEVDQKVESMLDQLHGVGDTERRIRRYRVQDMTLFLTVREMLTKILASEHTSAQRGNDSMLDGGKEKIRIQTAKRVAQMHLHDFGYDDFDFDFFAATDGAVSYSYKHKSGIEITMPSLSLNNYGAIFRVLGDEDRIDNLLDGLKQMGVTKVSFAQMTAELAQHDRTRTEFLRLAQQIEQQAYDRNKSVLANNRHRDFYNKPITFDPNDHNKITNPSTDAKRNHFKDLVEMLQEYDVVVLKIKDPKSKGDQEIDITLADVLRELRNAAAHNRYPAAFIFDRLKKQVGEKKENIIGLIVRYAKRDVEEAMKKNGK